MAIGGILCGSDPFHFFGTGQDTLDGEAMQIEDCRLRPLGWNGVNLTQLQYEQKEWADRNFKKTDPTPIRGYRMLLGAFEELGELAHSHLKEEQGIRGTPGEHQAKGKDAIGDTIIYLMNYCSQRGWSISDCVNMAWDEVKSRDWNLYPVNGRTE